MSYSPLPGQDGLLLTTLQCDIVWYVHRKNIRGEIVDIVLSNVTRKYAVIPGYKIIGPPK